LDPLSAPLPVDITDNIEAADTLAVSAVTCWEVAWLHRRGRIELTMPLENWLDQGLNGSQVICFPIDRHIAVQAAQLPEHHRDPADRLIIATAIAYQAKLVSLDEQFSKYYELTESLVKQ